MAPSVPMQEDTNTSAIVPCHKSSTIHKIEAPTNSGNQISKKAKQRRKPQPRNQTEEAQKQSKATNNGDKLTSNSGIKLNHQ